jgi:hypothetical protein
MKSNRWLENWLQGRCDLLLLSTLLVIFLGLHHFDYFASLSGVFQQENLHQSNVFYLQRLEAQLGEELGHLLALQTLVDVAASSQVGISFILDINVEVGRLLSQLSNVLEKGNEVVLLSLAGIGVIQALATLCEYLSPWFLEFFIVLLALWSTLSLVDRNILNSSTWHAVLRSAGSLFLVSYLIIPYSIHLSSGLSNTVDHYFEDKASYQYFSAMSNELSGVKNKGDLKQHAKTSIQFLHKASSAKLSQKTQRSSYVVMQFAAKMALTLFIIPALLMFGLYYLICRLFPIHHICIRKLAAVGVDHNQLMPH